MVSRRSFLKAMSWAPVTFTPALFSTAPRILGQVAEDGRPPLSLSDFQLRPHYPAKSALDDVLRYVDPGLDKYITEKYAAEIHPLVGDWAQQLKTNCPATTALAKFLDASIAACELKIVRDVPLRSGIGVEVSHREFAPEVVSGREKFLDTIKAYFAGISRLETAEFEIIGIEERQSAPLVGAEIRYSFVGVRKDGSREQRIGKWVTEWFRDESGQWRARRWQATQEVVSRVSGPMFVDVTSQALGEIPSYKSQMLHGVDYWRTVLDGACGIDIYGNNGVAVGDFDNDGHDDIYICQPAGLPNRLYRNRGDGTFEDVTEQSGVGVLDATACALFADFENKGRQDLLVVCGNGPLLFVNGGNGRFSVRRDAFQFEHPPQGTFTHAAVADYDRDGRLDIYFCLYSYYLGLDQYHYPAPYFDARNGPPNFLLHNEGNGTFRDRTEASGLNIDNDRYSFACAWGDHNSDGWPDLYVANDFGRSNLYRNHGDGTFTCVSREARVEDAGAGMSACWFDCDNDGKQDIYVGNMWSAAGIRVSQQQSFHEEDTKDIRALYGQHARGNSLYRNRGDGHFENVGSISGTDMGRWAWCSDAWDFDHDGWPDLYVANGYISGPDQSDVASFFWRRVVGKSPRDASPSTPYEQGWNAINELIRSDHSWSGYERNVFYLNNRDGTFSDISGLTGLDFRDDSRAFALADLDADGRLEMVLKNRNTPQLRILRNAMKDTGNSISFRLRGHKSNRDAIGTAVTVEAQGQRQTKYLHAGSGFLSQHTKELFFGVGAHTGNVRAVVRWPSGVMQHFDDLPVGNQILIGESSEDFLAKPFANSARAHPPENSATSLESLPTSVETWLIEPLRAPDFSLPDLAGKIVELGSFRGSFVLLSFWTSASQACQEHSRLLQQHHSRFDAQGIRIVTIHLDEQHDITSLRALLAKEGISVPVLLGNEEVAGVYNILFRYLYDRRRNLPLPTSFLVAGDGAIIKIYQGPVNPDQVLEDLRSNPTSEAERLQKALPFAGKLHLGSFQRNDFSYGVALFQHGYLEQATASFKQVIAAKPRDPEAYYNLGTLYLRRNDLASATQYLEKAVGLRSSYPEAWNNLGMIAAQQGQTDTAILQFQRSLQLRPGYTTALLNLGNLHRRQGNFAEAEKLLLRALDTEPDNAEVNYSLGMLCGQRDQIPQALSYFEKALTVRPDYADALNNLGVLLIREKRYSEAEKKFKACIDAAPQFDQAYLNLARLYVMLKDRQGAETVLQGLLRRQPQHRLAQQMLEMLR